MWMDPLFMDGQDPTIFGIAPNLSETLSRLRYKKYDEKMYDYIYNLNGYLHTSGLQILMFYLFTTQFI